MVSAYALGFLELGMSMTITGRQIVAAFVVLGVSAALGFVHPITVVHLLVVGFVGAVSVLATAIWSQPTGVSELPLAIESLDRGEVPSLPANASVPVSRAFQAALLLADRARNRELEHTIESIRLALDEVGSGRKPTIPKGVSGSVRRLWEDMSNCADAIAVAGRSSSSRQIALRSALSSIEGAVSDISEVIGSRSALHDDVARVCAVSEEGVQGIARRIGALGSATSTSASNIAIMISKNDDVASSIMELASSVHESAASIEQMTFSIKEVAKNVDALSQTAEETSSSMTEMDTSIDHVQANANDTARLSEEVALDAERGAEAIQKTIGEINRIKESTSVVVDVISNLGTRIKTIGQILSVIDDVAEQTNLLALNAAIIAEQAGEHGRGFVVVADEIKDLAERSATSTKEIAELTRTIQAESKNAITAVDRGAMNVHRGVEVSIEAERALKKILDSSRKSTSMVRAIARATDEQARGSRQVTDAIARIAETVQQIATATAEQARGSEIIMRNVERMREIAQHVERSTKDLGCGGRDIAASIGTIASTMEHALQASEALSKNGESFTNLVNRTQKCIDKDSQAVRRISAALSQIEIG